MEFCIHCMEPLAEGATFCQACGSSQAVDCPAHYLRPGTLLSGRYLLGAVLGEGGFGITYIARDMRLCMTVAVKEFYPAGYVNRNAIHSQTVTAVTRGRDFFEQGKRKFLNEARLLAELHDEPGIVDVRDFFEENNSAYIVMEYLRGETLRKRLARVGRLPFLQAYGMLRPVMESLIAAHKKNVVHRDIAPDNIMLTRRGAKLLDFGAAREVFSADERSLSIMVKRGYSPLEQYTKRNQGPWTDVYALCATLYRCVTGKAPGDPLLRAQEPLRPMSAFGAAVPQGVEAAIAKGLEPYPEKRFQNVQDLLIAINKALRAPQPPIPVGDPTLRIPAKRTPPAPVQTMSSAHTAAASTPKPRPRPVTKAAQSTSEDALPHPKAQDENTPSEKKDSALSDDALLEALDDLKNDDSPDTEEKGSALRTFLILFGTVALIALIIYGLSNAG